MIGDSGEVFTSGLYNTQNTLCQINNNLSCQAAHVLLTYPAFSITAGPPFLKVNRQTPFIPIFRPPSHLLTMPYSFINSAHPFTSPALLTPGLHPTSAIACSASYWMASIRRGLLCSQACPKAAFWALCCSRALLLTSRSAWRLVDCYMQMMSSCFTEWGPTMMLHYFRCT